jgi:hypothetical protein
MVNIRRKYSPAEELALTTEVLGRCPICGHSLFYTKNSRTFKAYDLAHIYPLNPTAAESEELKEVAVLHADVNHPDNIIPLCNGCHTRFDKPRTRAEYEELAAIKRQLLQQSTYQALFGEYPIEEDIRRVVRRLHTFDPALAATVSLDYVPKGLDEKFDLSMPHPIRQKLKHAVSDYYSYIKNEFRDLERESPASVELIYTQVRAYYLKQKALGVSQPVVFRNVVDWLRERTHPDTPEAAEILAAFFVQNCEVFK